MLRTSGGADAPAVVALRAPLRHFAVPNLIPSLRPSNKGVEEDREDPVLIVGKKWTLDLFVETFYWVILASATKREARTGNSFFQDMQPHEVSVRPYGNFFFFKMSVQPHVPSTSK